MTPNEQAAFAAGVEAMRQMAMIAAVTIETRDDAGALRQRAAAAALHGLAEGARDLLPREASSQTDPVAVLSLKETAKTTEALSDGR